MALGFSSGLLTGLQQYGQGGEQSLQTLDSVMLCKLLE
jgi:hypothetical protein